MRRALLLGTLLLGGAAPQSALDPQGPQAGRVYDLFLLFLAVSAAVWVLVVLALGLALLLRRGAPEPASPLALSPYTERRARITVGGCVVLTAAILVALTVASYFTGKGIAAMGAQQALPIRVSAHQWWWEVTYQDPDPAQQFITANEILVPVGRPVRLILQADDVIHSLWVPNLFGKLDLIPGRDNTLVFQADRAGTYRGQCAEFCGFQHAHMSLTVTALAPAEFEAWRQASLQPAPPPQNDAQRRGQQVFAERACALCHTVQGTPAAGKVAPDLTHLASRPMIAAGMLPMNRGNLAAWIADPQGIKPGVHMPLVPLPPDDFNALLDWLESLR